MATIQLPDKISPPIAECDQRLGEYMRYYNQLEIALHAIFEKLLDTNITAARVISNPMSAQSLRDAIKSLGGARLKKPLFLELEKLLDRAKTCAGKRNFIVHGVWQIQIHINRHKNGQEMSRTAFWARWYEPSDPATIKEMYGPPRKPALIAKHKFTPAEITKMGELAFALAKELNAFTDKVALEPYLPREPLPIS